MIAEGRRESLTYRFGICVILILGAVPILLPFYWMLLSSLKTKERIEATPPDWLPVVPRSFVVIDGQELPVKVFDDGEASGTGVARAKIVHESGALLRLPAARLAGATADEYYAVLDGIRRRVVPLPSSTSGAADAAEITVTLVGTARTLTLPVAAVEAQEHVRTFWHVLGTEFAVESPDGALPAAGEVRIRWDAPLEPIRVVPDRVQRGPPPGVRWRQRLLPVERVAEPGPGGYELVRPVCPADGLIVPVDELRREVRTTFSATIDGARRDVRWLEEDPATGRVRIEVPGLPETARVPAATLERVPRTTYSANVLGQEVTVETVATTPETGAAEMRVRVPGALAVDAARIRTERPIAPQWWNFALAWKEQTFDVYVANTLFIAALVVLGTVLSCGLVGYAFARLEFRGRDALFLLLLATMMIPGQVTSIPTFVLYVKFGWIDTYKPLILPSFLAGSAFFVFLYRQFMLTIPVDLEDSARIDGCGPLQIWWLIIMPLSKPIIVTVAVFSFIGVWNDFLGPLLYINSDEKQTVALGLQNFKSAFQYDDPQLLMAASVMMLIPSVVLFFIAQKAFIRGVVVSGVKG